MSAPHAASAEPGRVKVVWQPQPGPQTLLLSCPVQEIFFGGARGGGKTDGGLGDWLSHAARYGAYARGIWLRRTYPELEPVLQRMAELFGPLGATFAATKRVWTMPGGATLSVRYLDRDADAEHYQGHSYTWLMFDELGNWPDPRPVDKIRATLRSADGVRTRMLAAGNPGGRGHEWVKKRYITPAPPMTPFRGKDGFERVFIPSRLSDNARLAAADPGYRDQLVAATVSTPWLRRAWLNGDWNVAPSGGAIRIENFRRYEPATFDAADVEYLVLSVDTGTKDKEVNDPTAAGVWAVRDRMIYLLDLWVGKPTHLARVRAVRSLCERWQPHCVLIEDKGSGESLIQHLREDHGFAWSLEPVTPTRSKLERMLAECPAIDTGRVHLPEAAPWLLAFESECSAFPLGGHDDQVDQMSQALAHLRTRGSRLLDALNG